MAKRSREDFEPSSSPELESESVGETPATARLVVHPSTIQIPCSTSKFVHLDLEISGEAPIEMRCSLPPHRGVLTFASYDEYDVHYAQTHTNRCLECRKNFPTEHFLTLHIEENHDAMTSLLRERGEKTYSCFVEDCDRKCSTPQKRRMHLVDKHMFPKDYDFYVVNDGIDRRSSMLRSGKNRRRSSTAQHLMEIEERNRRRSSTLRSTEETDGSGPERKETSEMPLSPPSSKENTDMDCLSGAMSALKFVPPSVRFGRGRGRGRGGFSRS
ncbi:uncharacterized protein L3040_004385 [Drepanopeziza brunnea f. sp. 'multigermtubi']|uniref:uncharacterized protein n=1 Tax=Drepanopeziza brunnea f. sp. 'multigermtubi' TaxID=698441 RepID=UPI002395C887|nr:hypothetical protein L3040_004385 [Drepanopeziza brunnea f. sp. 'multigermtubi']